MRKSAVDLEVAVTYIFVSQLKLRCVIYCLFIFLLIFFLEEMILMSKSNHFLNHKMERCSLITIPLVIAQAPTISPPTLPEGVLV